MYTLSEAFALIVLCLKTAIAPRRDMAKDRMAFLSFIWLRLHRLNNRVAALYARWKNGTLPKPGAPRPGRTREARPAPAIRLPQARLWLIKDTQAAAGGASLLRHWIATNPEFQEFLEAAPQLRRMLNPLCHALGIDIDKPYGVPLVKAPHRTEPSAEPTPPPEPSRRAECIPQSADPEPPPRTN